MYNTHCVQTKAGGKYQLLDSHSLHLCASQKQNDDMLRLLSSGDHLLVYGYPTVINTPKYHTPESIAIKAVGFKILHAHPQHPPPVDRMPDQRVTTRRNPPSDIPVKEKQHSSGKEVLVSEVYSEPDVPPTLTATQLSDLKKLEDELYKVRHG